MIFKIFSFGKNKLTYKCILNNITALAACPNLLTTQSTSSSDDTLSTPWFLLEQAASPQMAATNSNASDFTVDHGEARDDA